MNVPNRLRPVLLVLALLIGGAGLTIHYVDNGADHGPDKPRHEVIVHYDGPDRDRAADDKVVLTPKAVAEAKDPPPDVVDPKLHDETPPGSPIDAPGTQQATSPDPEARKLFAENNAAAKRTTTGPDTQLPLGPLAAQSFPGCSTRFISATSNYGTRIAGARPAVIFLHYWGSRGIQNSLADMNGLLAFQNNPRALVSWHLQLDRDGHCFYTVPLEKKAYTEAAANSFGIGIEMEGAGTEPDYGGPKGRAKLVAVIKRLAKLYGIPIREAIIRGCHLVRSGISTHWPLGSCGGGHVDIKPYALAPIIAAVRAAATPKLTKRQKWARRHAQAHDRLKRECPRGSRAAAGTVCRALREKVRVYHRLLARA